MNAPAPVWMILSFHPGSNNWLRKSCAPQPGNLRLRTRLRPTVNNFMKRCQVLIWLPRASF